MNIFKNDSCTFRIKTIFIIAKNIIKLIFKKLLIMTYFILYIKQNIVNQNTAIWLGKRISIIEQIRKWLVAKRIRLFMKLRLTVLFTIRMKNLKVQNN